MYLGYVEYRKGAWQEVFTFMKRAEALIDRDEEHSLMGRILNRFCGGLYRNRFA